MSGIINKAIINFNEIPEELIINKVKGAYLHTDNNILKVQKDEDVAYVIDRVAYDQFLFKRAINNGVQFINQKVTGVDLDNGIVTFVNNDKISSKIVVGADGYKSEVSKSFGNAPETFNASQLLVKISDEAINSYRQVKKLVKQIEREYEDNARIVARQRNREASSLGYKYDSRDVLDA